MNNPKWSVVVTTAPRKKPKLKTTIQSLRKAGWDNPVVFAEPDSPTCDATTHTNDFRLGVFQNWLKAAWHGVDSGADVIMTVQDDVWFDPESKWFAEKSLWPKKCGFLSLYTPKHYSMAREKIKPWGINRIFTKSLWGAMAMIWHPTVLKQIVSGEKAKNWIGRRSTMKPWEKAYKLENPQEVRNVDTFLGYCVREMDRGMYYVNPSFAQHISTHSSIGNRSASGKRSARFMVGSDGNPTAKQISTGRRDFS